MSGLLALMVTPLSGPLQRFGSAAAAGLRVWAEHAAELPAPWRRVHLDVRDAHPDVAFARRQGLTARPHFVFGPYGSGPTLRALATTQRIVWNHGGASARIRWPAFPHAENVLAPAPTYFQGTLEAIRGHDPEARRVTVFHSDTGFGRDIARGAIAAAQELGFDPQAKEFTRGHARRAASSREALTTSSRAPGCSWGETGVRSASSVPGWTRCSHRLGARARVFSVPPSGSRRSLQSPMRVRIPNGSASATDWPLVAIRRILQPRRSPRVSWLPAVYERARKTVPAGLSNRNSTSPLSMSAPQMTPLSSRWLGAWPAARSTGISALTPRPVFRLAIG